MFNESFPFFDAVPTEDGNVQQDETGSTGGEDDFRHEGGYDGNTSQGGDGLSSAATEYSRDDANSSTATGW
jgi:hypothetical protein